MDLSSAKGWERISIERPDVGAVLQDTHAALSALGLPTTQLDALMDYALKLVLIQLDLTWPRVNDPDGARAFVAGVRKAALEAGISDPDALLDGGGPTLDSVIASRFRSA